MTYEQEEMNVWGWASDGTRFEAGSVEELNDLIRSHEAMYDLFKLLNNEGDSK